MTCRKNRLPKKYKAEFQDNQRLKEKKEKMTKNKTKLI
jgi:hypothetical protein